MRALRLLTASSMFALAAACGCMEQSPDVPSEEDIRVAKENILPAPPASMKFPVNADLEGKVIYLGMDIDTDEITPGKPFTLTHYWKVNEPVGPEWKVFIHLEAPGTKASHLNADHVPIGGKYPVSVWKKGDVIRDTHRVSVPAGWRAPAVEIYAGLWKGPARMNIVSGPADGEKRAKVASIPTDSASAVPPVPPRRIVATKVKKGAIKVDGKLDEAAWARAPVTPAFVRALDGGPAESKAEAKLLWDDERLYVAFEMEDKDVWTTLAKADAPLWTQEAVEVFLDADGDGKTYVEIQTNPKGAIFDTYLPTHRVRQDDWSSGTKVGVKVAGTVDRRDDEDQGWTVEMAIPLAAAMGKESAMNGVPPMVGTVWKANFFRVDMPAGRPNTGTAWSAPMSGDYHDLAKFGELVFGDDKGRAPVTTPVQATVAPAVPHAPSQPPPGSSAGASLPRRDPRPAK